MPSFVTTRWTLVERARGGSEESRRALNELCGAYWQPIYAFVRRRHDAEAARDLTQGFFVVVMERALLHRADASLGRFRSFLLTALKHFLDDEFARRTAAKRGGGVPLLPLDVDQAEARYGMWAGESESPERAYERAWAETLLERAMNRLRVENKASGAEERFEQLRGLMTGSTSQDRARAGTRLGLSDNAVRQAVHRLRVRYHELLREEVADTVATEEDVDVELAQLREGLLP